MSLFTFSVVLTFFGKSKILHNLDTSWNNQEQRTTDQLKSPICCVSFFEKL